MTCLLLDTPHRSHAVRLALLLASVAHGEENLAAPDSLDDYVARVMKPFAEPALSVAIVEDGRTVVAKGYNRRLGAPEMLTPEIDDAGKHPRTKDGKLGPARTVSANCLRPPDLIIQDELHLISGPLGTLVGLYETAIDRLCSWRVGGRMIRPKMIASTATIRQAKDQVHALFLRNTSVFPPNGLDVRDNLFSLQRPSGCGTCTTEWSRRS